MGTTMKKIDIMLWNATCDSDISKVKEALRLGANPSTIDEGGDSVLMMAVSDMQYKSSDIPMLLIDSGADVNAVNFHSHGTALMSAAVNGYTEIVKAMLEAGANVNAINIAGSTALMHAKVGGHNEIVDILKMAGAKDKLTQDLFIIKVWLTPAPPKLVSTTGGWLPVAINVPEGTAVCVFPNKNNASIYSKHEEAAGLTPSGMTARFEVAPATREEIVRLAKATGHAFVAPEPEYSSSGPMLLTHHPLDDFLQAFSTTYK